MFDERQLQEEVSQLIVRLVREANPANEEEELRARYFAYIHLAHWAHCNGLGLQTQRAKLRRKE